MNDVADRAKFLAPTDDPTIPHGLAEFFTAPEDDTLFIGVDKAATPAERIWSQEELQKDMLRQRPQFLIAQRDSDACKDVESSRIGAFAKFSNLKLRTGSTLIDQFCTSYIPRVYSLTLPWCVGGPDFPNQPRYRRPLGESSALSLDAYTSMVPARCEYQMRADWGVVPGIWSLYFATKVNLGVSMSMQRVLRRGGEVEDFTGCQLTSTRLKAFQRNALT